MSAARWRRGTGRSAMGMRRPSRAPGASVVPGASRSSPPLGPGGPFLGPQSGLAPSVEGQCGLQRPGTGPAQPAGPKAGPVGPGRRPAPPALWAPGRPWRRTRRRRVRGAGPALQVGPSPSPGPGRGSRLQTGPRSLCLGTRPCAGRLAGLEDEGTRCGSHPPLGTRVIMSEDRNCLKFLCAQGTILDRIYRNAVLCVRQHPPGS